MHLCEPPITMGRVKVCNKVHETNVPVLFILLREMFLNQFVAEINKAFQNSLFINDA